jgi:hypothetical protein
MIYTDYLDRRKNTFYKSYELILNYLENKNNTYNIVELGSCRSYVNGNYEGCCSSDNKYWQENNPEIWDWGAGIFTKVFAENLSGKNYKLHTVDPSIEANIIVSTMCKQYDEVQFHMEYSSDFLNNFNEKIDFLYMDHMETSEEAAIQHLIDIQLIIEKDLLSENAIILIDDIGNEEINGKGKYSIPFLEKNNYKIILHEHQVLMVKNN